MGAVEPMCSFFTMSFTGHSSTAPKKREEYFWAYFGLT